MTSPRNALSLIAFTRNDLDIRLITEKNPLMRSLRSDADVLGSQRYIEVGSHPPCSHRIENAVAGDRVLEYHQIRCGRARPTEY